MNTGPRHTGGDPFFARGIGSTYFLCDKTSLWSKDIGWSDLCFLFLGAFEMNKRFFVVMVVVIVCAVLGCQSTEMNTEAEKAVGSFSLKIWPDGTLGAEASLNSETSQPAQDDNIIRLTNVTDPTITVYKPEKVEGKTPAVVICPGGAYSILAMNLEGTEIAKWFNSIGITAVVLKYRVPGQRENAFKDVQRAMRVVRYNAADWGIDSEKIGVMGFSAGGHLAARASGAFEEKAYEPVDDKDKLSCRPDFTVLIYPAYLVDRQNNLSKEIKVEPKNPSAFIVQTQDDGVRVENGVYYYMALKSAGVASELHIFPKGGHGYGMRPSANAVTNWPSLCKQWLRQTGVLKTTQG